MKPWSSTLAGLVAVLTVVPCFATNAAGPRFDAAEFKRRDPVTEAAQNFHRGQIYIFAAMGVGMYYPGIEDERTAERIARKYSVKYLGNTSDVIESKAHLAYIRATVDFAAAYNRQMVHLLSEKRRGRRK